jgi:hypothetical protein
MLRPRKQQRVGEGYDARAGGGRGAGEKQGIGARVPEREMESCIGRNARQAASLVNELGFAVFPSVVPRSVSKGPPPQLRRSCLVWPGLVWLGLAWWAFLLMRVQGPKSGPEIHSPSVGCVLHRDRGANQQALRSCVMYLQTDSSLARNLRYATEFAKRLTWRAPGHAKMISQGYTIESIARTCRWRSTLLPQRSRKCSNMRCCVMSWRRLSGQALRWWSLRP